MTKHGPLPFMKSAAEAQAMCVQEHDPFYLTAFMFEGWLGNSWLVAGAEYAEKKNAKDRTMQTGQAWRGFQELFGHAKAEDFPHVYTSLFRFSEYEGHFAESLSRATIPVSYEHEFFGDFVGPNTPDMSRRPIDAVRLMRRSVERWCEWLDALIHFQTHEFWHLSPASFDPDPDKRELAALGINQRNYADLSEFSKTWWQWHHGEAAERFKDSAKWQMVGKAMASDQTKTWDHPELDATVISLWPLVKRYNWTYRDLMAVVRQVLHSSPRYPLEREQELAAYCANVLGLHKPNGAQGKSSTDGRPRGHEIALRLCRRKPQTSSS